MPGQKSPPLGGGVEFLTEAFFPDPYPCKNR